MIEVYCDQGHPRWVVARYARAHARTYTIGGVSTVRGVFLEAAASLSQDMDAWIWVDPPTSVRKARRWEREREKAEADESLLRVDHKRDMRTLTRIGGPEKPRRGIRFSAVAAQLEGRGATVDNKCSRCATNAAASGEAMARVLDRLEASGVHEFPVLLLAKAIGECRA